MELMFYSFGWVDGGKITVSGGCKRFCRFLVRREAAAKISEQRYRKLYASPGLFGERSRKIHAIEDEKKIGERMVMPLQVPGPSVQDACFYHLGRDSAAKTRAELKGVPICSAGKPGGETSLMLSRSGTTAHSFPHFWGVINVQMKQSGYCIGELRRRRLRVEVLKMPWC